MVKALERCQQLDVLAAVQANARHQEVLFSCVLMLLWIVLFPTELPSKALNQCAASVGLLGSVDLSRYTQGMGSSLQTNDFHYIEAR